MLHKHNIYIIIQAILNRYIININIFSIAEAYSSCGSSDRIKCPNSNKCIRESEICNNVIDCKDSYDDDIGYDEDPYFCSVSFFL